MGEYKKIDDIKNFDNIKETLENNISFYKKRYLLMERFLNEILTKNLKPKDYAMHKEFGKCQINSIWPSIKDAALYSFIRSKYGGHKVKYFDLFSETDRLAKILYKKD